MLKYLTDLFTNHPYMSTAVATLFTSSAVGAMPSPQLPTGFYRWFFDFIHAFTGGIFRVLATRTAQAQVLDHSPIAPATTGILAQPEYEKAVDVIQEKQSKPQDKPKDSWTPKGGK